MIVNKVTFFASFYFDNTVSTHSCIDIKVLTSPKTYKCFGTAAETAVVKQM